MCTPKKWISSSGRQRALIASTQHFQFSTVIAKFCFFASASKALLLCITICKIVLVLHMFWGSEAPKPLVLQGFAPPGRESPQRGRGGSRRLTESDFRRLEVVRSSLGICYYEVVSPGSAWAQAPRFWGSRGAAKKRQTFLIENQNYF